MSTRPVSGSATSTTATTSSSNQSTGTTTSEKTNDVAGKKIGGDKYSVYIHIVTK